MYKNIMNLMNSLEERYHKDITDNTIENTENEFNILLAIDPITIACSGLSIAAGGVLHFENEKVPAIMVDHIYLNMNKSDKSFIIAHELGHLVCQLDKFKATGYTRNIEDEFEADEYALRQVGFKTTIKALINVTGILANNYASKEQLNEMKLRIKNIINKSMITWFSKLSFSMFHK